MRRFPVLRNKIQNPIKSKVEIRFFELTYPIGSEFELISHDLEKVCVKIWGDRICYPKDTFEDIN